MLPFNELWNVESRWAAVCLQMLLNHDYLHPQRYCGAYYDKPLLSYWLIIFFAKIFGSLNLLAIRLPTALSGLLTVWATYALGKNLFDRKTGLIAGWLLISTFYFVFWSRTASADMLNLAGCMLAILWYYKNKNLPTFFNYLVFFTITAITSLFKGLLGFVIPSLVILPDLLSNSQWKKHLKITPFIAFIIASLIYLAPFFASAYTNQNSAGSGLMEVFRENILRFIKPFDHQGPLYLYFYILPIYTLPAFLLFIPTLVSGIKNWKHLHSSQTGFQGLAQVDPSSLVFQRGAREASKRSLQIVNEHCERASNKAENQNAKGIHLNQRWLFKALLVLFLFLTLSGSRRSYYVLPLVPFVILLTAHWLKSYYFQIKNHEIWCARLLSLMIGLIIVWFLLLQPIINFYHTKPINDFVTKVRAIATKQKPWNDWKLATLPNEDLSIIYYLDPKQPIQCINQNQLDPESIAIVANRDIGRLPQNKEKFIAIHSEEVSAFIGVRHN